MLLTGGRIYLMDGAGTVADTVVVRDGRVAFAGRRGEVNAAAGERVVSLGGRAVLPGLIDAHAHLWLTAKARLSLDAGGGRSEDEIASRVAAAAARAGAGEWITGRGWDQTLWPGQRFPSRASLDRAAPGRPVALTRVDGHATWASSAALAAAGVTRRTPDPPGGIIERDAAGEPTGLLVDAAQDVVRRAEPPLDPDRLDRAIAEVVAEFLAKGLTGVHEMGADGPALAAYRRLIERGRFPFRNHAAVIGRAAWEEAKARGVETLGDGRLVVGGIKLWLDGALGSRGAALHDSYCDAPGNTGLLLIPPDELARQVREAAEAGFQVCVHAIGDRANTVVLDVFEAVLGALPSGRPARPLRVEHAQVLTRADVPRFGRLGVLPSMQPVHCTSDARWAEDRLGRERLTGAYAWRSVLDAGSPILGGSDVPVEDANPFHGIHAAVTRHPVGAEHPAWPPEQRMTREEAVRAFTAWNARAVGCQGELGTLAPGARADLVVLSDDVLTCGADRIRDVVPELTMLGGEVVFTREAFAGA